jgi:hypothetical protein
MNNIVNIEKWWTDHLKNRFSGYDLISQVINMVQSSNDEILRTKLNDFLTKKAIAGGNGYAIAFGILQNICNEKNLNIIYEKACLLEDSNYEITYFLRVIAKNGNVNHKPLLERFFMAPIMNENASFVHWSLFPNFPDLFAKSYSKYLIETEYKDWKDSSIVQSFMDEPNALNLVKSYLKELNPEVWGKLVYELKRETKEDLWSKKEKKEILRIIK